MLSNQAKIESLLFISGNEGITLTELSQITGILKPALHEQLDKLADKYKQDRSSSLQLIHAEERYKLVTKPALAELVKKYLNSNNITELTGAALETLAIIAYKQPITRIGVDEIRGVQSSSMIQRLQLLELIKENGRLDALGRPILYVTTDKFLDYFGLESLDQLPELDEEKQEDEEMDLMTLFEQTTGSTEDEEEE